MPLILGLESSCDETAAALVDSDRRILAHRVAGQEAEHRPYGGVVPEIAARAHVDRADLVTVAGRTGAMPASRWPISMRSQLPAGPGLIGGVLVGLTTAKAMALVAGKPLVAVNHLEAHALTARLTDRVAFPYLLLLASGGHTQLLAVKGVGDYAKLGTTIDDAIGEAFDKVAKLVALGYPGGPQVEKRAMAGNPARFALPRPLIGRPDPDFSLSGLKTAVRLEVERLLDQQNEVTEQDVADICASFQMAVADMVADRAKVAIRRFRETHGQPTALVVAGGVGANQTLKAVLQKTADAAGLPLVVPPPKLCTDNGAMIAWAGAERFAAGLTDPLDTAARPRWPLDPDAEAVRGAGVKA
jgi:N6-L-threonylcarbamoyladenine synthase